MKEIINKIIKELQNEILSFDVDYDEFDVWRETYKRNAQIEILKRVLKEGEK